MLNPYKAAEYFDPTALPEPLFIADSCVNPAVFLMQKYAAVTEGRATAPARSARSKPLHIHYRISFCNLSFRPFNLEPELVIGFSIN